MELRVPPFCRAPVADPRQEPAATRYWWWGVDVGQVSAFWYSYQSRWIPAELFSGAAAKQLAHVLFAASRRWTVALHFNKGPARLPRRWRSTGRPR